MRKTSVVEPTTVIPAPLAAGDPIGFQPVYGLPPAPAAPEPSLIRELSIGGAYGLAGCSLALGAFIAWQLAFSFYGGQQVQQAQAEARQAQAALVVSESTLDEVGALVCK